ncbi:hypothetical protein [Streptomyces sp. H27-D2]|uniref:hypothetical protein n=1 Tax=Streptomyces sp. H27-D2 TaxID=3046304 RepID=UPI002DBE58F9|nr:hypothetical protein [Streptomyces sp. H27-D2]MEC4017694.1 hypothetical protein [Streptomyces sp. H27-D2]
MPAEISGTVSSAGSGAVIGYRGGDAVIGGGGVIGGDEVGSISGSRVAVGISSLGRAS